MKVKYIPFVNLPFWWKSIINLIIPSLILSQKSLRKPKLIPSDLGLLWLSQSQIVAFTSSNLNSLINLTPSMDDKVRNWRLSAPGPLTLRASKLAAKWEKIALRTLPTPSTWTPSTRIEEIKLPQRRLDMTPWKNFEFASHSLSKVNWDWC